MVDNAYIRLVNVVDEIEIFVMTLPKMHPLRLLDFGEIYRYQMNGNIEREGLWWLYYLLGIMVSMSNSELDL